MHEPQGQLGWLEAELADDIGAFIEATCPALGDEQQERAAWGGGVFNALALRLFAYQCEANPAYADWCQRRGVRPARIANWREIPAVPLSELKYVSVSTGVGTGAAALPLRQHQLYLYLTALMPNLHAHLFPDMAESQRLHMVTVAQRLDPNPEAARVFSAAAIKYALAGSGSFTDNYIEAMKCLIDGESSGERICIMGGAKAIIMLAEYCAMAGRRFHLNPRSRLLYSCSDEQERAKMYARVERVFGISRAWCVRLYSPAPGGSQFYDSGLRQRISQYEVTSEADYLQGPPWTRLVVRNPNGGTAPLGSSGQLCVCDLSNLGALMMVQTNGEGRMVTATVGQRERFALVLVTGAGYHQLP